MNPELGQLDNDDAYRRWQARMTSYRRGKSRSHPNKNRRNRSVHTRGYHPDQRQVNNSSGDQGHKCASGHHVGVPPSPASPAPGMRLGAAHDAGGASLSPSVPANDNSTAVRQPRPARRQHCRGDLLVSQDARLPPFSLPIIATKTPRISNPRTHMPSVVYSLSLIHI